MLIVFQTYHWKRFTHSECGVSVYDRGRYLNGDRFEQVVLRYRPGQGRHMSVGRFRRADLKEITHETPCFIPWTIIEPEEGDVLDRWEIVRQTAQTLDWEGIRGPMHVRFSGNQSFWLCIPSGMMGNPLGSVEDQKVLRRRVFLPLIDAKVDEHLWDGRHLMRVPGSMHEKGGPVRYWSLDTFMNERLDTLFKMPDEPYPNPALVPVCPVLLRKADASTHFFVPAMDTVSRDLTGTGVMRETEGGVDEGDRNDAAFKRACYLVRRMGDQDALFELRAWNTQNNPPLPERELRMCLRSARRIASRAA